MQEEKLSNKPHLTSNQLIEALHLGYVLFREHHNDKSCTEYLFVEKYEEKKIYDMRGWGTAYGTVNDRLAELIRNPKEWKIVKNYNLKEGYPYPWSTGYKTHQS